ncbi:unnamed protein product [Cladocopium goreaui]|uniref:Uncharacterized protein n=1 Tax=Cladocopium goreaui TaxID=2562237 RepID=A0A9P1C8M7_9DINO|nr:unnamed protein product [Cladocopium goreaui]
MLAVVLLAFTEGLQWDEVFQAVEVFSGKATLSKCLLAAGYATASLDIVDWKPWMDDRIKHGRKVSKRNPLDLTTAAGFGLLISTILRSKSDAVYAFGLVCSSFVSVSRGSTFRHYFLPLGDPSSASAQLGNLLCARMILALILIMSRGGVWLLEQPVSSLVFRHPRFRELLRRTTVWRQSFWMRGWGARTPKRTTLWSNSRAIRKFQTASKFSRAAKSARKLADVYYDRAGNKRYKGNRNLKSSQEYPVGYGIRFTHAMKYFQAEKSPLTDLKVPDMENIVPADVFPDVFVDADLWKDARMPEVAQQKLQALQGNATPQRKQLFSPSDADRTMFYPPPTQVSVNSSPAAPASSGAQKRGKITSDQKEDVANAPSPATTIPGGTHEAEKALTPGALLATLRRICSPKPSSGKLEVSAEDAFKKHVEHIQKKSRRSKLHVAQGYYSKEHMKTKLGWSAQRIRAAVAYCTVPKRVKSHTRKDKYEGTREYWVDVETTGSFENENEESFLESTAVSGQGEDIELGLTPAAHADGEDSGASNDEDDDDDDDQASSVRTKNKGMGPEAESALEAVDNLGTVMGNLLKTQAKLEGLKDKLSALETPEGPGLVTKVQSYCDKLITLHDELADLKSYFDGVKHSANPKPDQKTVLRAGRASTPRQQPGQVLLRQGNQSHRREQVSEAQACSLADAFWEEFGGLEGSHDLPSANFLKTASRLSQTGHAYLLSGHFEDYKLAADIPFNYKDVGLGQPHPVLSILDFVKTLDTNGKLDLLFMGNAPQRYEEFWGKWRARQPHHPIYRAHGDCLGRCVPVMVHADEGTSQKKKGVMIVSVQPVLGHGTSKRKATETVPGVNYLGKSLVTRMLYSVMLARVYSGKKMKNKPLLKLVEHLALELRSAFYEGIPVNLTTTCERVYLVPIGMKGDWAALVKCGQLVRHHLRDVSAKKSGAGICHLCLGGQESHNWFDISYDNMEKMRDGAPPPWSHEPAIVRHLPLGDPYKHHFFRIDVFHTLHKGVFGDIAANAIVSLCDYACGDLGIEAALNEIFSDAKEFCKKRCWYKGADTTSLLLYLEARICLEIENVEEGIVNYFKQIHEMIAAANGFMKTLFHCALWLSQGERDHLI